MKKFLLTMLLAIVGCVTAMAAEPDILLTQNGESLKVYNLDISVGDKIYYTLEESEDAPVLKINKSDVLVIKKADGTVINLSDNDSSPVHKDKESVKNPDAHESVTYVATSDFIKDKKGNQIICVEDNKGQKIYFRLVPDEDKTLAVTKWQGKGKYDKAEYIIPEYVKIGNDRYTVVAIDDEAFQKIAANTGKGFSALIAAGGGADDIKHIRFPLTLKRIGKRAFFQNSGIEEIILPEGLEEIGKESFRLVGGSCKTFKQLYIPASVKAIGADAFKHLGPNTSPRGYFQGNLSCIPDFITTGNCTSYGIDEEAVETYERKNR